MNKKGITLIELVIGLGVGSLIFASILFFAQKAEQDIGRMRDDVLDLVEELATEKIIQRDLRLAIHSFNFVKNPQFEQLVPDYISYFFDLDHSNTCVGITCRREINLEFAGQMEQYERLSFYLLTIERDSSLRIPISPERAYKKVVNADENLIYVGLNNVDENGLNDLGEDIQGLTSPWQQGKLLLLSSEIALSNGQQADPVNRLNMSKKPKFIGMVGQGTGDTSPAIRLLPIDQIEEKSEVGIVGGGSFQKSDYLDFVDASSGFLFTNTDSYLRRIRYLPMSLYLTPVEFIRYTLVKGVDEQGRPSHRLERTVARVDYGAGKAKLIFDNAESLTMGQNILRLTFTRQNISNGLIDFNIRKATSL